jgi:site-specific DNA-methyltransferase (adenine-specific)
MLGNCLELMPQIPSGSVDMVLCDLPYGTTACKWDTVIPFAPLWAEYKRIIKKNGAIVLFGSEPFTSLLVCSNIAEFKYKLTWDKVNTPTGHLNAKKMPLRRTEDICVFYSQQPTYNPEMTIGKAVSKGSGGNKRENGCYGGNKSVECKDVITRYPIDLICFEKVQTRHGRMHPTQKPVALCEYLIKTYTNEGETVLDNTMGSGTTGVAAVNTGRNFIGIEQENKYFEIAKERICG